MDWTGRHLLPLLHVPDKGLLSNVPQLSDRISSSFMLILVISVGLLVLVTFFMIYFAIRYRRKRHPEAEKVKESLALEIAWTVIPTILVFIMFYVGWENFTPLRKAPPGAMTVHVTARMWSWQFEYENGLKSSTLNVPVGKSVSLLINSTDVIHSLFIPHFKIKEDAVPGLETKLWLVADREGEYNIFCAEYCGQGHSSMLTKVIAMSAEEFSAWYNQAEDAKDDTKGPVPMNVQELLDDNGCLDCHSTDGSIQVGPTFKGIYGRKETVISEGKEREIAVDDAYVRKSIIGPDEDVVKGFPDVMPSFEEVLSSDEINAIIEYLKQLK